MSIFCVPVFADTGTQYSEIERLRRLKTQVNSPRETLSSEIPSEEHEGAKGKSERLEGRADDGNLLVKAIKGLSLCLGIFFVFVYFLKKQQGIKTVRKERRLILKEQMNLGGKNSVALISVDGREMLVGVSESNVHLLQARQVTSSPQRAVAAHAKVVSCVNE
ncbi:MAG: flagellar biosynthetic protein FliO [Bdellovibrionota bacterium]|jgi:flagellar biogenesis protein FliO